MNNNLKNLLFLSITIAPRFVLSSNHHYVSLFPGNSAMPSDVNTPSVKTNNCKETQPLQSTPRPPITLNQNNSPEGLYYGNLQNINPEPSNSASKAKQEIPLLNLNLIKKNLTGPTSSDSTISSDLTIDDSTSDNNYERRFDNSTLQKAIMKDCTHFYIIPSITFFPFMEELEKIIHWTNESKKIEVYEALRDKYIWGEVQEKTGNNSEKYYSLQRFIIASLSINDFFIGNKDIFYTNQDPESIKKILSKGLLPEHQNSLFQETLKKDSKAFLNHILTHSLILYGCTLELLESFYLNHTIKTQYSTNINATKQDNINALQEIAKTTQKFNPLINPTNLKKILKDTIICKIRALTSFYNNIITDSSIQCIAHNSNQELVQKYSQMVLYLTDRDYNTIAERTITHYNLK